MHTLFFKKYIIIDLEVSYEIAMAVSAFTSTVTTTTSTTMVVCSPLSTTKFNYGYIMYVYVYPSILTFVFPYQKNFFLYKHSIYIRFSITKMTMIVCKQPRFRRWIHVAWWEEEQVFISFFSSFLFSLFNNEKCLFCIFLSIFRYLLKRRKNDDEDDDDGSTVKVLERKKNPYTMHIIVLRLVEKSPGYCPNCALFHAERRNI